MIVPQIVLQDDRFLAAIGDAKETIGFATIVAMTRTARTIVGAYSKEVQAVFDRPTPTTINAFYFQPAAKGLPVITVGIKDFLPKGTAAAKYLRPQIEGGPRRQKRSEVALMRAGHMGNRGFWVPGKGMRLNPYGNVPGPLMVRILSALKAMPDPGQNVTKRSAKRNKSARQNETIFLVKPGDGTGLSPGVWMTRGRGKPRQLLVFVPSVNYRKRFDFFGLGRRWTLQHFPVEYGRAVAEGWNEPKR